MTTFSKSQDLTVLKLPVELRLFLGRPSLKISELLSAGATLSELVGFCEEGLDLSATSHQGIRSNAFQPTSAMALADRVVWPVSRAWGMGFAWPSFVAQSCSIAVAARAGLSDEHVLAPMHPSQSPLPKRSAWRRRM